MSLRVNLYPDPVFVNRINGGFVIMCRNMGMWLIGSALLATAATLSASEPATDAALGEQLVRGFFANPAGASLAAGFQSVHQDGARDRDAERALLKQLQLGDYALADFKVTREADLLIVTYSVAAQEMIDGQPVSTEPSYRLSVFIPEGEDWQLLAHANLVAIQPRR
ncbi:MAG: nuclear transport factor 2 family protein [Gammaproteobacteria bacterium]|nr:nuclear transport factor 2 family protein [Gammaproteobacteria bacterium]